MGTTSETEFGESLHLTTNIVAAYVSNNSITAEKIPTLLQEVHDTVKALAAGAAANEGNQTPAVSIKKSITPDFIICLEDGKKLKMLKRYIRTQYGLSPEEYRRKWGLPADYPMVAPNYAKRRSQFAKDIGLGRGATKKKKTTPAKKKTGAKRGRPRKSS